MLKNGKSDKPLWNLHAFGCSCCNTKQQRRRAKHSMKSKEKTSWKKEARES